MLCFINLTQVNKIEVQYDKKSKQVDVHILKETLWSSLQEMHKSAEVSFLFLFLLMACCFMMEGLVLAVEDTSKSCILGLSQNKRSDGKKN